MAKYADEIDVCLGDYKEKGKLNSDMAVYKLDWTHFMTKDEIKQQEEKLEPLVKPTHPDLKKARRVVITREEIKMK